MWCVGHNRQIADAAADHWPVNAVVVLHGWVLHIEFRARLWRPRLARRRPPLFYTICSFLKLWLDAFRVRLWVSRRFSLMKVPPPSPLPNPRLHGGTRRLCWYGRARASQNITSMSVYRRRRYRVLVSVHPLCFWDFWNRITSSSTAFDRIRSRTSSDVIGVRYKHDRQTWSL